MNLPSFSPKCVTNAFTGSGHVLLVEMSLGRLTIWMLRLQAVTNAATQKKKKKQNSTRCRAVVQWDILADEERSLGWVSTNNPREKERQRDTGNKVWMRNALKVEESIWLKHCVLLKPCTAVGFLLLLRLRMQIIFCAKLSLMILPFIWIYWCCFKWRLCLSRRRCWYQTWVSFTNRCKQKTKKSNTANKSEWGIRTCSINPVLNHLQRWSGTFLNTELR